VKDRQMLEGTIGALSADKPLSEPQDDRLGYASFAQHLADSVGRLTPPEGFVVALYGPWGTGKTTLLQFIEHFLREKSIDEQPIFIHFNPWWFSGHEDLTRQFFYELQVTLHGKLKIVGNELRGYLADFSELVAGAPIPFASAGRPVSTVLRPKTEDVPDVKGKIASLLKKQQHQILVIMDDIDRLTAEEIRQIFRLMKAVADFPKVTYLLAFDREIIIRALEAAQEVRGEAYLEKVIQLPLEIPLPDKNKLEDLLLGRLNALLAGTPKTLFDQNYWEKVYDEGIRPFINTPRDVIRLTNVLAVTYPAVRGEVNPVDFMAMEALRAFYPAVYDIIHKHPLDFARPAEKMDTSTSRDLKPQMDTSTSRDLMSQYDSISNLVPPEKKSTIKQLLGCLFPRTATVWGESTYGTEWDTEWRKRLLIRSAEIFPAYFRLSIPEDDISHAEMHALLAQADDAKAFGAKLMELSLQRLPNGSTRVRSLLDRLQDYTIAVEHIPAVLKALFEVGDTLLDAEEQKAGMLDLGNDFRIERIFKQLLQRLEAPMRFRALQEAMSQGHAVATIVLAVEMLGKQHGKYGGIADEPPDARLVNEVQLKELEALALSKIRSAAQDGTLLTSPHLPTLLQRYRDWAGEAEVKKWVHETIQDDTQLVPFIEQFLQNEYTQTLSDGTAISRYRLDPQWFEPFIEPSDLAKHLENLDKVDGFTSKQQIAIKEFLQEYSLRQQGKDPDDARNWADVAG
jgi:predicted KAP-like P-loop ATPase